MARCGCVSECNCVIVDGDCTTVAGNGNPGAPYQINAEISATGDNQLTCEADGLYVPEPTINILDTDCIDLSGDGSAGSPLQADLVVSADAANLTECSAGPNPGVLTLLNITDGFCVDLDGAGTIGDPLSAELIISPDAGNVLECRANGAYSPAAAQGTVDYRATIVHTGACPTVLAPAAINVTSETFIDYDVVEESIGLISHLCGATGAYANTTIEVPVGGAGVYLIQATHPAWSTAPTTLGDMILRLRLWRGDTTGRPSDGIGQSAQTRYSTTAGTNYNTPYLHVSRTIVLADGDVVGVSFAAEDYNGAFAGATLDVGPTYGVASGNFDAGYAFFQMTRIGTA